MTVEAKLKAAHDHLLAAGDRLAEAGVDELAGATRRVLRDLTPYLGRYLDRQPYVGAGVDGCERSAAVDEAEADTAETPEYRDVCLASAARWREQAERWRAAGVTR